MLLIKIFPKSIKFTIKCTDIIYVKYCFRKEMIKMYYVPPDYYETTNIVKLIKKEIHENTTEAFKAQDSKLAEVVFELLKF
jgi:hypothetical protein